jgi:hypothetical protein
MGEQEKPPALPGEVWRGVDCDGKAAVVCVRGNGPLTWRLSDGLNSNVRATMSEGDCARAFAAWAEHERAEVTVLRAQVLAEREAYAAAEREIRNLLASAHPHPNEHPTMTAAWKRARAFLGEP